MEIMKKILSQRNDCLIFDMDFCQNQPLPKLRVNAQFYRRLLWLYLFNINCLNKKKSYLAHFLEGEFSKGSFSVISSLLNYFQNELYSDKRKKAQKCIHILRQLFSSKKLFINEIFFPFFK